MAKKIRIATSPLTNTIFAGDIKRPGEWKAGKQDVTMDCLNAVAEHAKNFGKPIEVTDEDTGNLIYRIIVEYT
jgi:hypothetical protein